MLTKDRSACRMLHFHVIAYYSSGCLLQVHVGQLNKRSPYVLNKTSHIWMLAFCQRESLCAAVLLGVFKNIILIKFNCVSV